MTEEQEKYIIEKYPSIWDGVWLPSEFTWAGSRGGNLQGRGFTKYVRMTNRLFSLKKDDIIECFAKKTYTNFRKISNLMSLPQISRKESRERFVLLRNIAYFMGNLVTYEQIVSFLSFTYSFIYGSGRREGINTFVGIEENSSVLLNDSMLVFEIIRPDIIAKACTERNRVLLEENFARIDQILLKYNKYVYCSRRSQCFFREKNRYGFVNPKKVETFKYFISLLIKNKYVSWTNNYQNVVINERIISESAFICNTMPFLKKNNIYNSRAFCKTMHSFFGVDRSEISYDKCPHILNLIFKAVQEYDNKISNQQKTKE